MDTNRHKYFMLQILKDIFADAELASCLGFKGGTALMFFYGLPRFSVDLDFNLLDTAKENEVFEKVRGILLKYGKIHDEAVKFYGPIVVLDYGHGERKLKVEISNRQYPNRYEMKNLLGINVRMLAAPDMFAHKLCALLDRTEVSGRDIFDCWFFLKQGTPINSAIVQQRMGKSLQEHIDDCVTILEKHPDKAVMSGLGDLMDPLMKNFVRKELRGELIQQLRIFQAVPITDDFEGLKS